MGGGEVVESALIRGFEGSGVRYRADVEYGVRRTLRGLEKDGGRNDRSRSALMLELVADSYLTAASSAAVQGVVRELFAARTDATFSVVTGAALLPHALRT